MLKIFILAQIPRIKKLQSTEKDKIEADAFSKSAVAEAKDWIQKAIKRPGALHRALDIPRDEVVAILNKREIQKYIDTVYMDSGYRNRFKLAETLDKLIDQKLEEAEESEIYTNKDLADLIMMQHKIRMDEMKAQTEFEKAKNGTIKTQNNVQINTEVPFGQGNYGTLMKKLLEAEK